MTQPRQYTVLGGYALVARLSPELKEDLYRKIPELGIDALEVPISEFVSRAQRSATDEFSALDLGLDAVVTCIPSVMQKLKTNLFYGLASRDERGRQEAVRDVVEVLELSDRLAVAGVRGALRAIEVNSAPRPAQSSLDAFEKSLREILAVTPQGIEIVVEHCDAPRPDQPFEKGFLEISDEIAVLQRINDPRLGLVVNWGRSAIEGRSADYVSAQIAQVAQAGLLKGLMFSGVAGESGSWGSAWEDNHMPPRGEVPVFEGHHASLLGADEFKAALYAAGPVENRSYTGVKVGVPGPTDNIEHCYKVAEESFKLALQS